LHFSKEKKKYGSISISISNPFFRFQDSGDSLGKLTPENKDKEILVPLTGSMYVPGQLSNAEKVLVDVGTGRKI
jgi:prefoldin subunit 5